jgi:hypothetical protein
MSGARSGTRSEFPARRNVIALQIIPESQSIGLRTGGRKCLFLALRVISRRCSTSVAVEPERTSDRKQARLDQSKMPP